MNILKALNWCKIPWTSFKLEYRIHRIVKRCGDCTYVAPTKRLEYWHDTYLPCKSHEEEVYGLMDEGNGLRLLWYLLTR